MKKVTNKNEIAILSGRWVTKLGNVIFDYINSISLANINTQNSVLIAIYQSSETIISLVMNLFSGVYADKTLHKKRMLIITDLISGLICIALSLFIHDSTIATVIIIANCLLAIVNSLNSPLYKTIIRETKLLCRPCSNEHSLYRKDRLSIYCFSSLFSCCLFYHNLQYPVHVICSRNSGYNVYRSNFWSIKSNFSIICSIRCFCFFINM